MSKKHSNQRLLTNFFEQPAKRIPAVNENASVGDISTRLSTIASISPPSDFNVATPKLSTDAEAALAKPCALSPRFLRPPLTALDISLAVDAKLNDSQKLEFLDNFYKPDANYKFVPVIQAKIPRNAHHHWLINNVGILAFSHVQHGFYCVPCVVFAKAVGGKGGHQFLGKFVKSPFRSFKDFSECWSIHQKAAYHLSSLDFRDNFKQRMASNTTVYSQIVGGRSKKIQENRAMLKSILRVLQFIGKHDLPLRGDDDSGPLFQNQPDKRDGIFRGMLRLLAETGDHGAILLRSTGRNASLSRRNY
ncbi:hypothetical protein DdX_10729 [Ditylenchus destructor]|uniref:Uncharacterized protein n=1 Tax=Ditylenchus destructor TaxID=166010 RepID=A0AAD4R1V3_9BILA|nr:hypothetical protein DdX_10729 [Ditylenchus destructor]